jgi:ribosomal protein L27
MAKKPTKGSGRDPKAGKLRDLAPKAGQGKAVRGGQVRLRVGAIGSVGGLPTRLRD